MMKCSTSSMVNVGVLGNRLTSMGGGFLQIQFQQNSQQTLYHSVEEKNMMIGQTQQVGTPVSSMVRIPTEALTSPGLIKQRLVHTPACSNIILQLTQDQEALNILARHVASAATRLLMTGPPPCSYSDGLFLFAEVEVVTYEVVGFNTQADVRGNKVMETIKMVGWCAPCQGWIKLNTDGCCKSSLGRAGGGGGLLRDWHGKWLKGFVLNIGSCSAIQAELLAAVYGLRFAWEEGYRQIMFETDSTLVAEWLRGDKAPQLGLVNMMVTACQGLLKKDWIVQVNHVYREGNRAADFLANEALQHPRGLTVLSSHPADMSYVLWDDAAGITWPRRVKSIVC